MVPSILNDSTTFWPHFGALIIIGTIIQMIHHKNVTYFFNNAKKAKLSADRELGAAEKTSVILKTVVHDIATTAELGAGKRRVAHVLGMYGTILFWVASVVMVFCYTGKEIMTPTIWPMIWHIGAIMTCVGGYWFWLFLSVFYAILLHLMLDLGPNCRKVLSCTVL